MSVEPRQGNGQTYDPLIRSSVENLAQKSPQEHSQTKGEVS